MTCRQFSLGRTILESVKVFLQAVSQAENQKMRTNPKKENTASIGYRLAGLPLGKRGIFPRDLGRSDRMTRADSPANASEAGSLHGTSDTRNLGTQPGLYTSQGNRCPSGPASASRPPATACGQAPPTPRTSHLSSHTPAPGTVPKPLSSPSHPHSIPDCFPPPAPSVP